MFVTDAHRDNGESFIVAVDEKLTAFLELESAIRAGYRAIRRRFAVRLYPTPQSGIAGHSLSCLTRRELGSISLNGSRIRWRTFLPLGSSLLPDPQF
jgi:hypothetical protein